MHVVHSGINFFSHACLLALLLQLCQASLEVIEETCSADFISNQQSMVKVPHFLLYAHSKICICHFFSADHRCTLTYLLRLSSSRSEQNIGQRVVSIWHDRWQYLSRHSSHHPICPNLLSVCLAMSSLVFQPSFCHLLVSNLGPDW